MRRSPTTSAQWLLGTLVLALSLGLAACGASSSNAGVGTTTTNQATGCPGPNQIVSRAPASVLVSANGSTRQVTLKVGQTLEVQLPFGRKWSLFPQSADTLSMTTPAGYGDVTVQSCIWRFTAAHAGSTTVTFDFAPLCPPTAAQCSQLAGRSSFTITVQ